MNSVLFCPKRHRLGLRQCLAHLSKLCSPDDQVGGYTRDGNRNPQSLAHEIQKTETKTSYVAISTGTDVHRRDLGNLFLTGSEG